MASVADLAFHFSLGVAAFFSPCGFPMLPAYLAYYLPRADEAPPGLRSALARGAGAGALAAAGAFLALTSVGLLAALLGTPFKSRVKDLELVGGLVVLTLGVLMLTGRGPSFKVPLSPSKARGALAVFGFGALYAAVAASCVAPLLLLVFFNAFEAPTLLDGALLVGAYAAGLATLLLGVTILVATAQTTILARMKRVLPHVEKAAGAILVLVGAYLVLYWAGVTFGFPVPQLPTPSIP